MTWTIAGLLFCAIVFAAWLVVVVVLLGAIENTQRDIARMKRGPDPADERRRIRELLAKGGLPALAAYCKCVRGKP